VRLIVSLKAYKHVIQLTGFLAACVALYSWCTAPVERLEADVYFADFEMPPAIAQQLTALAPLTNAETSRAEFFRPNIRHKILPDTSGTVDQILGNIAQFVHDKAPLVQRPGDFLYKGFWRVTVRNPGSRTAANVVVHLPIPAAGVVARGRLDQAPPPQPPATPLSPPTPLQAFPLGNVQGGQESVVLYAWTLAPPTEAYARQITLTHDLGSGRVRIVR
jgi:hypothetical protein